MYPDCVQLFYSYNFSLKYFRIDVAEAAENTAPWTGDV